MAKRQHAVVWRDGSIEILGTVPDGALLLASGRTDGLVKILNATTALQAATATGCQQRLRLLPTGRLRTMRMLSC